MKRQRARTVIPRSWSNSPRGIAEAAALLWPRTAPGWPATIDVVLQRLPGWTLEENRIAKEFQFKDFVESLGFVSRLVPYFEQKDHHRDVHIYYHRVRFELSRYDMGGESTDRDVEVTKLIELEYARVS